MEVGVCKWEKRRDNIPKSDLHATNVIHLPVLLGDILLSDRDTSPSNVHLSNAVHVILIELNFEVAEVALGPLSQTPFLDDQRRRLQLDVFSVDVSVENGEFTALMGPLKLTGWPASKYSNALGVREGVVQLLCGGAELV